jgi:site-specific DNA recombinase
MIATRKSAVKLLRCAIYTRQSIEDAQVEFGSLDAQREAIAAYITSQRGEGWAALPERYDDAGFSGATTQRPAFQRLLRDIDAGLVDVVCVYKLDRLSRSLNDFVALMERFRRAGVAFVSVTQKFETTSPLGRMTLNLLATFAEFEREQISERTRDKMLAARRRGMWTGGPVPLGYDLVDKKLVVNEAEADQVRWLYATCLDVGSLMKTVEAASARGIRTKSRKHVAFTTSTMARLLKNPIYIGMQSAGAEVVDGLHAAIIEKTQAEAVKAMLRSKHIGNKHRNRHGVLLRGLLMCAACGASMTHSVTSRWHYYVCSKIQKQGASACPDSRVRLDDIESAVVEQIRAIGRDPKLIDATIAAARVEREGRMPELIGDVRRLEQEHAQKERERSNLIEAVAHGGAAVPTLMNAVATLDKALDALARQIQAKQDELVLLQAQVVDEDDLRRTLANFDDLWGVMFVRERERVLRLLIQRVAYDGRTGEVEVVMS